MHEVLPHSSIHHSVELRHRDNLIFTVLLNSSDSENIKRPTFYFCMILKMNSNSVQ
jgi:hypothetical protein